MYRVAPIILSTMLLAACGGGGEAPSDVPAPPVPPVSKSPGGIWFGFDSSGENVSFYISETGQLRVAMRPTGELIVSFGGGAVSVTPEDEVSGAFELRGIISPPTLQKSEDLGCSLSGELLERQNLSVDIVCSDSGGIVYDESVTLRYDGRYYERPSSLDALAGTYTLGFQPDTNTLTVLSDGTVFGTYHNGARCTIDGTADVIDSDYTLIGITWTMSACTDFFGVYEGTEMSGFALAEPVPTVNSGGYYFLLTGYAQDGLYAISVLYEPT